MCGALAGAVGDLLWNVAMAHAPRHVRNQIWVERRVVVGIEKVAVGDADGRLDGSHGRARVVGMRCFVARGHCVACVRLCVGKWNHDGDHVGQDVLPQ